MTRVHKSTIRQLRLDLAQQAPPSRRNFVVSGSNRSAFEMLERWPNWPGGRLAIVGPRGSGKTHLASTWADRVGAVVPDIRSSAVAPMLIENADREANDEGLFHAFNRADSGATLLLTGRTPPSMWRTKLPDLRSRLNALTIATLDPPDDAVLLGVMERLFRERNIRPTQGVPAYIIRRVERSVFAVKSIVDRIDQYAGEEKREVTLSVAREMLGRAAEDFHERT